MKSSALILLFSVAPLFAATPVDKLPGVIDASSWKRPTSTPAPSTPSAPPQGKVYDLVESLNQLPDDQLNEKSGVVVAILQDLRTEDGPEYTRLKTLLGRADVRKSLHPGAKGVLAGLVAPRWDAFILAGNLWLAALQSQNADLQEKARQHLINFIQPAHIPVLINLLKVPGPNVMAFGVLQDVSGQKFDPNPKTWKAWWNNPRGHPDLVGHLLNQTRNHLKQLQVQPFDQAQFWYLPEGVSKANIPYARRSASEQNAIGRWNDWANSDVKRYVDTWDSAKPLFDTIVHQPDPRIAVYLKSLIADPGMGDYVSVVLAWRGQAGTKEAIQEAYNQTPSVGRALARGSMGDSSALQDLLRMIEAHPVPLSYGIMDDTTRDLAARLLPLGVVPAEQAFELLAHQRFGLAAAMTPSEKRKAFKKAKRWMKDNIASLKLDPKRGFYITPAEK